MADSLSPVSPKPATNKKNVKAPRRRRGGMLNLLLLIGIIVTIGLFVWAEQERREAQDKLKQTATELEEVRKSSETSRQEVADQVLEKVGRHMVLPSDPKPTVATIVDIDTLKAANEFYSTAQNGDHLVVTEKRAILYDLDRDIILDVVPVSRDAASATATPDADVSPSPSVSVSPFGSPGTTAGLGRPTVSPTITPSVTFTP